MKYEISMTTKLTDGRRLFNEFLESAVTADMEFNDRMIALMDFELERIIDFKIQRYGKCTLYDICSQFGLYMNPLDELFYYKSVCWDKDGLHDPYEVLIKKD